MTMTDQTTTISTDAKALADRPKGWKMTTLGEVIFPVSDTFDFNGVDKVHFLNTGDILEGKLLHNNLVSTKTLPGQAKKRFKLNDILYSEIRPANKRYMLVNFDSSNSVASTKLMVLRAKENVEVIYIYKYITFREMLNEFQTIAESRSGTFPQITFDSISKLELFLPPLPEQRAIAKVLSSLDDKIELLREQNKTLEATAQAIFKEWFVKFNFPGATGKMIDSELGKIPEGWRVNSLSKIAVFMNGLALQKFPPESITEYLPVIKIRELSAGVSAQTDRASARLDKKYIVEDGDILFSWSGSLVVDIWKYGKGALNQHLFKITSNDFPKWFYYQWTKEHLASFQQTATAKAVTMGHIQRHHLDDALVVIPDDNFLKIADAVLAPMLNKFINNNSQIQALSTLRDTLLPKLMKGEVRVVGFNN